MSRRRRLSPFSFFAGGNSFGNAWKMSELFMASAQTIMHRSAMMKNEGMGYMSNPEFIRMWQEKIEAQVLSSLSLQKNLYEQSIKAFMQESLSHNQFTAFQRKVVREMICAVSFPRPARMPNVCGKSRYEAAGGPSRYCRRRWQSRRGCAMSAMGNPALPVGKTVKGSAITKRTARALPMRRS